MEVCQIKYVNNSAEFVMPVQAGYRYELIGQCVLTYDNVCSHQYKKPCTKLWNFESF